jgi:putative transposase
MSPRRDEDVQTFASVQGVVHNHFNHERHLTSRATYELNRSAATAEWRALMG